MFRKTNFHLMETTDLRRKGFRVVTDEGQLRELFVIDGKAPLVDFDSQVLILAERGVCRTGGYSIRIEDIRVKGGEVEVVIRETDPSSDAAKTLTMTCPRDAVLVPRSVFSDCRRVRFVDVRGRELHNTRVEI